ncbi:MAG: serine hydrolase domain-containing protein, partial [Ilumatobacteraceae bacterium]
SERVMSAAVELLDSALGIDHDGYQLYVSVRGRTLLDVAGGVAAPGVDMTTQSITLWFSAGKPVTAVAIAQLWEAGRLGLDDRVSDHIPAFANGKQAATIRHLLIHTGGFPYADDSLHPGPWAEMVASISAAPAMFAPGSTAAYHGTAAHVILAEIVRLVDGRPIEQYAAEEIFTPLGMASSFVGIAPDRVDELRPRLALIQDRLPLDGPGHIPGLEFAQFNDVPYLLAVSPGNTCRGPARELGILFEALLGGGARNGARILQPQTVEAITACHRRGMVDQTFAMNGKQAHPRWGHEYPWGLGVELDGNGDIGSGNSSRVFASSGAFSSVGFADPETGLVCVIVTTGLIELQRNQDRLAAVADAVNAAIIA